MTPVIIIRFPTKRTIERRCNVGNLSCKEYLGLYKETRDILKSYLWEELDATVENQIEGGVINGPKLSS